MARLIAKSPLDGALPVEIGAAKIEALVPKSVTWVAPFDGQAAKVDKALAKFGGLPGPGEVRTGADGLAIWCGPGQALIFGPVVQPEGAAVTDQSDAFAMVTLSGAAAVDVLARLTPLDLRESAYPVGTTARTLIFHMTASLTRVGVDTFQIMVFRSMAETLIHDLTRAMKAVASREAS